MQANFLLLIRDSAIAGGLQLPFTQCQMPDNIVMYKWMTIGQHQNKPIFLPPYYILMFFSTKSEIAYEICWDIIQFPKLYASTLSAKFHDFLLGGV